MYLFFYKELLLVIQTEIIYHYKGRNEVIFNASDFSILETYKSQMKYFINCLKTNKKQMNNFIESIEILKTCLIKKTSQDYSSLKKSTSKKQNVYYCSLFESKGMQSCHGSHGYH